MPEKRKAQKAVWIPCEFDSLTVEMTVKLDYLSKGKVTPRQGRVVEFQTPDVIRVETTRGYRSFSRENISNLCFGAVDNS